MSRVILASGSPRRNDLLRTAEIDFEVIVPAVDEELDAELLAEELAQLIAKKKADSVHETLLASESAAAANTDTIIIAADTIVVLGDKILGKPASAEAAAEMLRMLSGKTHDVITGVCILLHDTETLFAETTKVTFKRLSEKEIGHYITNYEPFDKAGAYAIQEWIGLVGVTRIEGDYFNVVGLPVARVLQELADS